MGMGSKTKRSSGDHLVMASVVLALALLIVGAAAARSNPNSSCKALCGDREDLKPCHAACLQGVHLGDLPNCHLRCRHAKHYDTCFQQCKKEQEARDGGVGLLVALEEGEEARRGGGAGLLAMPTQRAG
ncbi:hypothetical protein D1007_15821 [Hordeum vulgare]|nr:hypothetical protein D1007_15821 [Hordeum vulgare]